MTRCCLNGHSHRVPIFLLAIFCISLFANAEKVTSEYELLRKFPKGIMPSGVPDEQGYVGFHAKHHTWFEAGMQRGGCWQVISAVVDGDEKRADDAWRSIDVTFAHQIEDGGFVSNPKPPENATPTQGERVETAFFYLQELGHAILVVQQSPMEPHFHGRIEALKPKITRGCAFVQQGYDGIILKVGKTANRILIAAKAMGLCGKVLGNDEFLATSKRFVDYALTLRDADGIFIERGGRDSSYNAVSLLMGQVLNLHVPDARLDEAFVKCMEWERTRILPSGEVLVKGNTRTGLGQEKSFDGGIKKVNTTEVALALCYYGLLHDEPETVGLGQKVASWNDGVKP